MTSTADPTPTGAGPRPTPAEWVDSDRALARLVERLASEPVYGLDTEFMAERSYWPRLCLVQLSAPGVVALVDPLACDVGALGDLLSGPATMVSHAAAADLPILERNCGARPSVLFDTQVAAGFVGLGTPSLGTLVFTVLGIKLDKSEQLADWSRRPLGAATLAYAGADVAHLLDLAVRLQERLDEAGRSSWSVDECERVRLSAGVESDPDTAWWKIKGARSLRGRNAGVAQAVAAWRERRARELDLPPRFVLSELALAGIATRPPRSVEALGRMRGAESLPAPAARALIEAVEAGHAMESGAVRRPPRRETDADLDASVGVLMAWVGQVAAREGLEGRLLATRDEVRELVNGRTSRLDVGWRAELVGASLRDLLAGRAALRLADQGRSVELVAGA